MKRKILTKVLLVVLYSGNYLSIERGKIFSFGLSIRAFEVTVIYIVQFLITFLVFELLEDNDPAFGHLGYSK